MAAAVIATALPARAQQPVFRSGTSIVEVTVIVRDRDGRFVRGLTPADLVVTEEGQPRHIELMYMVSGPERDGAPSALEKAPAAEGRQAPRTFVFAFDLAQMSPRSFTLARDAAVSFARQRLRTDDFSALAVLGRASSGRASHAHEEVIEGLKQLKASAELVSRDRPLREWPRVLSFQEASEIARGNDKVLAEARDRACEERNKSGAYPCVDPGMLPGASTQQPPGKLSGAFGVEANREIVEQELRAKSTAYVAEARTAALRSIASLESLARALEAIRGRKTIVWFTEGTPILEAAKQAREAAARAAQSGVAVYTIDPRGLQSRTADVEQVGEQELGHDIFSDTGDLPAMMASATGGLHIRNENRLDRALAKIEDDTGTYYVIGYAAGTLSDRSQRKVTVGLKREGLSARVRHGFMAPPNAVTAVGSMSAGRMLSVPGTRWELTAPTRPTSPPSTTTTPPTATHVHTTASNVLKLRGLAGAPASDFAARGWAAYERGDLEAALPLLQRAAATRDARPWALYALGFTYVGLGRPRDAVLVWERVRTAAPDFMPVYLDLAAHYAGMSDVSEALAVLREATKRWPGDPDAYNGIGVLLIRRGALGEAIEFFTKATQVAPDDPLSWLNLGRAYELRYDRARRYDEQLLKWVGPEGDRVKARQSYERCVKLGGPYAAQAADALARMDWSE